MSVMNKGMLAQRRRDLAVYAEVLPSLDLKRQQLSVLLAQERRALVEAGARLQVLLDSAAARLPMLADQSMAEALPRLAAVEAGVERRLGMSLPGALALRWEAPPADWLSEPPWQDMALHALQELALAQLDIRRRAHRIGQIEAAVRRTLQRVNLFERVLVPRARAEIRSLVVYLADQERAAIVRAKHVRARRDPAGEAP